ncbi:hypothetical protein MARPO_0014s0092 [Marchantia polymorpha]|uniref:Uncharacterized protein n=1 Tax=Marchantia polymorpha TaxID=3197 RepID=A0A2R6XHK0_MARPO|nr:hypothetical protein MARPO_0014s0092 [Marchantia polymorpha]|eukprot:PTQ45559.1 hypothetical protein MARPO_0014s0092 [Marchantia polymorpha]
MCVVNPLTRAADRGIEVLTDGGGWSSAHLALAPVTRETGRERVLSFLGMGGHFEGPREEERERGCPERRRQRVVEWRVSGGGSLASTERQRKESRGRDESDGAGLCRGRGMVSLEDGDSRESGPRGPWAVTRSDGSSAGVPRIRNVRVRQSTSDRGSGKAQPVIEVGSGQVRRVRSSGPIESLQPSHLRSGSSSLHRFPTPVQIHDGSRVSTPERERAQSPLEPVRPDRRSFPATAEPSVRPSVRPSFGGGFGRGEPQEAQPQQRRQHQRRCRLRRCLRMCVVNPLTRAADRGIEVLTDGGGWSSAHLALAPVTRETGRERVLSFLGMGGHFEGPREEERERGCPERRRQRVVEWRVSGGGSLASTERQRKESRGRDESDGAGLCRGRGKSRSGGESILSGVGEVVIVERKVRAVAGCRVWSVAYRSVDSSLFCFVLEHVAVVVREGLEDEDEARTRSGEGRERVRASVVWRLCCCARAWFQRSGSLVKSVEQVASDLPRV